MKKLFLPLLLMVAVSANAQNNPVLTIEGGQVQGVFADDHPGHLRQVHRSFLVPFAVYHAFQRIKVNGVPVQTCHFADPAPG